MNLAFAGCEIDLDRRRELRRAGQIVHVEPQVCDLLIHLLRAAITPPHSRTRTGRQLALPAFLAAA